MPLKPLQSFPVFSLSSSSALWSPCGRSYCRPLLSIPRVPWCISCSCGAAAIQSQRATVRRGKPVQDVRWRARVGVGLLRHQHFKEGADLRQQGSAQWAVLVWTFTWGDREGTSGSTGNFPLHRLLTGFSQIFTEGGEGRGVQDVPGKEPALRGRRPVGDEDVVMVIGGERERQSGHPGRIADICEEIVCRNRRRLAESLGPGRRRIGRF